MVLLQILHQWVKGFAFVDTSYSFTWLHLSDLHFNHPNKANQKIILDELLSDIEYLTKRIGSPDYILITGDIAFAGSPDEYNIAKNWIDRLLGITCTPSEKLFIVPGNHDIDRNFISKTSIKTIHEDIRSFPTKLDDYFNSPEDFSSFIWPKFKAFSEFANGYGSPALISATPFWAKEQSTTLGDIIIVGLNTALLSSSKDNPLNLALGTTQIQLIHQQPKDSLLLVLQHHPPKWLNDGSQQMKFLYDRPHILFCGHTHQETGEINYPIHTGGSIHFIAGAGYSHEGYFEKYSYSWGQLFSSGIRYYPRIWVESQFKPDRNRYNLDANDALFIPSDMLPSPLTNWLSRLSPFHTPIFAENEVTEWLPVLSGEQGVLCLKIDYDVAVLEKDFKHIAEQISKHLLELTKDNSIKVLAFTKGGGANVILKGKQEGFKIIINLFKKGQLSKLLDIPVINVGQQIQVQIYGATLRTSSTPSALDTMPDIQRDDLMLFPTKPYQPPVLNAIKAFAESPFPIKSIINVGDAKGVTHAQAERLGDYFMEGLTIKEENIWVNLSAYKSKKMIPENLTKTKLGRDLLAQDCILKRLTASLLHPDSEWGKKYWSRVYEEAERLFYYDREMTSIFNLYQKVSIVPGGVKVYETKLPVEDSEATNSLFKFLVENPEKKEGYVGLIAESKLKVLCETDYVALTEDFGDNDNFQNIKAFNDLCTSIFKETILPVIEEEVNYGQNFILMRQIFSALILATLCKEKFRDYPKWREFIDSGQKVKAEVTIEDYGWNKDENFKSEYSEKEANNIEDRLLPNFDPTQEDINNYFYNQYIDLFKKGLYSCTRNHLNPKSQKVFTRTYFSGGIKFSTIR